MSDEQTGGMSKKTSIILAVGFSLLAFVIFNLQLKEAKNKLTEEYGKKESVVVARKDLLAGTEIKTGDVELQEIPSAFIQPGAVKSLDEVEGRVTVIGVKAKEQLQVTKLVEGGGGYLSTRILGDDTRRAITLKMDGEGGLAGLITPGDLVDVIGVFESKSADADAKVGNHAIVIVQAVKVLAVDSRLSDAGGGGAVPGDGKGGRTGDASGNAKGQWLITMDVKVAEAWKLSLAAQVGHLRCVLRNRTNVKKVDCVAEGKSITDEVNATLNGGDVFKAAGKIVYPSGQPRPGEVGFIAE